MKEYVEEAKEESKERFFGEAYDHEKADQEQMYAYGYEAGIEKGEEKGYIKGEKIGYGQCQNDIIKNMYSKKISIKTISESVNLTQKEVKEIIGV